jgi:hypothetical protein
MSRLWIDWTDEFLLERLPYWLEMACEFGIRSTRGMHDMLWWACVERGLKDKFLEAKQKAKATVAAIRRR